VTHNYRVRAAALDDMDALVRHRLAMFVDMGVSFDAPALDRLFRGWLATMMPAGIYRAWLVQTEGDEDEIVAGGGLSVLPWPPGPYYMGDKLGVIYNLYTEPAHRRRGLARLLMETIHAWCRDAGVASVALNASRDGRPLYESMGYELPSNPMMFFAIGAGYNPSAQAVEKPTS
jgi:GNAT superfamily N-acetyltransferase